MCALLEIVVPLRRRYEVVVYVGVCVRKYGFGVCVCVCVFVDAPSGRGIYEAIDKNG